MKIDLNGFKKYLDSKSYSECTKTAYIEGVKSYIRHGYKEVSVELENEFRERLKTEGQKARSVNARVYAMNAYNKWVGLPVIEAVKINEDPFAVNGMDLEDYYKLLDLLLRDEKFHWYIIIKTLASTGMRIGEASRVTFGDIRRGFAVVYGKGGKQRTIYFSHQLQETLYMYIKDRADDELLIPYSLTYVRTAMNNIRKRYKLTVKTNPHEYRRFFARQMYESTHDAALLKGLLGHESINMTTHYIKKTQKQAMSLYARAQNWYSHSFLKLPPLGGFFYVQTLIYEGCEIMNIEEDLQQRVFRAEKDITILYDRMGKVEDKASSAWKTINEVKNTVHELVEDVKDLKVSQKGINRSVKRLSVLVGVLTVVSIFFFIYIWRHDAELAKSIVTLGTLVGNAIA